MCGADEILHAGAHQGPAHQRVAHGRGDRDEDDARQAACPGRAGHRGVPLDLHRPG